MIGKIKLWFITIFLGKYLKQLAKVVAVAVASFLVARGISPEVVDPFVASLEPLIEAIGISLTALLN